MVEAGQDVLDPHDEEAARDDEERRRARVELMVPGVEGVGPRRAAEAVVDDAAVVVDDRPVGEDAVVDDVGAVGAPGQA